MDNNATIKRRAQDLMKKGSYAEAAEVYLNLAGSSAMQPYDFVVLGDLLIRTGKRRDAVDRYLEALNSYAEAGLHRNAIALAKKVHRLAPDLVSIQRRLGDLYAAEGLASEASIHFVKFLEKVNREAENAPDEIEHVCIRMLEMELPSFDLVDRVVEAAKAVDRHDRVGTGVMHQARRAGRLGDPGNAERLAKLALELDPEIDPNAGTEEPVEEAPTFLDPGAVNFAEASAPAAPAVPAAAAPASPDPTPTLSLDDFDYEADPSAVTLDAGPEPPVSGNGHREGVPELHAVDLSAELSADEPDEAAVEDEDSAPAAYELDAAVASGTEADSEPAVDAAGAESEAEAAPGESPDVLRARALEFLERDEPVRAQRELIKAAAAYFKAGRSHDAEELYRRVVQMDPNHLKALRGLVEIAHINGERGKMAHWGCELGDVLLAREMYAEAKLQFERVLAFDSENAKARSRVNRLNTIAGVEGVGYGALAPDASEVEGAQVTVAEEPSEASQSPFDLSRILDEFRSSVTRQIPAEDSKSHYDLGVAYKEMGLVEEAVHAFQTAADSNEDRNRSLEMLGECYLLQDRFQEALPVFEELLPATEGESAARLNLQLGRTYEGLREWDKAEEAYFKALELNEDLVEAMELLESMEERRDRGAA